MKINNSIHSRAKVIPFPARKAAQYPNAASTRDIMDRIIDYALTAAASAGIVTVLVCLFTFF